MADISGGGIIAKMLKLENVDDFFGIVDGSYAHLFPSMVEEGIAMYSGRHESANAHMAGAYARLTGKLGVCIASNGPGVANMLSGAAVEHFEGNRVLLITSSRRTGCSDPDRPGAYQQFDQHAVIKTMSKHSVYIRDFERIAEGMREALRYVWAGRPGLVHVDVPENVINAFGSAPRFLKPEQYRRVTPLQVSSEEIKKVTDLLINAKRPMIQAGSGISWANAQKELADLAELLGAPVTMSWAAQGSLAEESPYCVPLIASEAVEITRTGSDVCLCLASSMGETDYWGKAPYWAKTADQKFIQVDCDEINIGRNRQVDLGILGDVKVFMLLLIKELKARDPKGAQKESRLAVLKKLTDSKIAGFTALQGMLATMPGDPIHPLEAMIILKEAMPEGSVFVRDGGNACTWATASGNKGIACQMGTWRMGHLGAGPGHAIGAAIARPNDRVCLSIGDGALGMHMQEMETAVRYGLNIVYVLVADQQWGMVKINHIGLMKKFADTYPHALGDRGYVLNTDISDTDWVKVAQGMGLYAEMVSKTAEMAPAMERCLAQSGPSFIMVRVDPMANMLSPSLDAFREMHNEPAGEDV